MCGITGATIKKRENKYWDLLLASEIRGQDGTGYSRLKKDEDQPIHLISVKKASELEDHEKVELDRGDLIIGQNRLATFGLTKENNQPIVSGRFSLVHNGNLFDFESVFKKFNLKRELQTDSELILRLIEYKKPTTPEEIMHAIQWAMSEIKGNMACLLLDNFTRTITAFCRDKPIWTAEDDTGLYFFSTERIGQKLFSNMTEFADNNIQSFRFKTNG